MSMNEMTSKRIEFCLENRIEEAFHAAVECRSGMDEAREDMLALEEEVILDNQEAYEKARSNQVRDMLLAGWMRGNEEWREARAKYRNYRNDYKRALLEIERLKLLVQARLG